MHIAHHLSGNLDVRRLVLGEPVLSCGGWMVTHFSFTVQQLRESDSSPQIAREHKWKTESKSKTCDYCGQMAMGSHLRCKHDSTASPSFPLPWRLCS